MPANSENDDMTNLPAVEFSIPQMPMEVKFDIVLVDQWQSLEIAQNEKSVTVGSDLQESKETQAFMFRGSQVYHYKESQEHLELKESQG